MATRNLTKRFEQIREAKLGEMVMLDSEGQPIGSEQVALTIAPEGNDPALPPLWIDIVYLINKDLANIKDSVRQIQRAHEARLKVSFTDDDQERDNDISQLTTHITQLMKKTESNIKRIALIGNDKENKLTHEEKIVRLNIMRALGLELQQQSKLFRTNQNEFMKKLKSQGSSLPSSMFVDDSSGRKVSLEEASERGLTVAEKHLLEQLEQKASSRDIEIIKIAQSVNELATLFKELNLLVVEQGTILDRIDYNLEHAEAKVKSGVQQLEKAEEISRKGHTLQCILVLLVIDVILAGIAAYKFGGSSSSSS